ncbi:M48 family metallopeptidase [Nocardioides marinquilinus]|uniref:M48 family metallopeptidase n=1 Tax=Nocardioides marinquilinus TaxID=1210400 RepID=A0ABP9P5U7_9ACTN
MTSTQPAKTPVPLPGISSRAWEHPTDRGALIALRKLKGFDTVLKMMSGLVNERTMRLVFLGSAVRVDERQFPELHYLLRDTARVLDVEGELPEMYVTASPFLEAMTIGLEKPIIVIGSALVDLLDQEELRFVVGHELGHALSGHAVYRTLLQRLLTMTGVLNAVPLGALGVRAIVAALYEWSRKAELSADRAGLLATQDPAAAQRVHMQLASGGLAGDLDLATFRAQGQEYLDAGDLRDSVLKAMLVERTTHPFAVVRAAELRRWVESGEYTAVLGGAYPRRVDDDGAKVTDAAREAAASYAEMFRSSQDAVGRLVHDLAGVAGSFKVWLDERLRRD